MAEDKVTRIARQIYKEIGGPDNVQSLVHCMTRVRLSMIDETKVNLEKLKAIDGVMGVVEGETLQVIVGPGTVNKVILWVLSLANSFHTQQDSVLKIGQLKPKRQPRKNTINLQR